MLAGSHRAICCSHGTVCAPDHRITGLGLEGSWKDHPAHPQRTPPAVGKGPLL